jgi:hypothetical protein
MVTTNNDDDSSENENIKFLIDGYKQKQIREKDVKDQLIFFGRLSGFINNIYRKQAWNLLINHPSYDYSIGRFILNYYYYLIRNI